MRDFTPRISKARASYEPLSKYGFAPKMLALQIAPHFVPESNLECFVCSSSSQYWGQKNEPTNFTESFILHLKSNQGSSIQSTHGFEAYGFKIKISVNGRRIWPEDFKRYIDEKLAIGELITKNVAKTSDFKRTMVHHWKREIRNKDRIDCISEEANGVGFIELVP